MRCGWCGMPQQGEAPQEELHRAPLTRAAAAFPAFPSIFPGFGFDMGRMSSLMNGIQQEMDQLASFIPASFGAVPATRPKVCLHQMSLSPSTAVSLRFG